MTTTQKLSFLFVLFVILTFNLNWIEMKDTGAVAQVVRAPDDAIKTAVVLNDLNRYRATNPSADQLEELIEDGQQFIAQGLQELNTCEDLGNSQYSSPWSTSQRAIDKAIAEAWEYEQTEVPRGNALLSCMAIAGTRMLLGLRAIYVAEAVLGISSSSNSREDDKAEYIKTMGLILATVAVGVGGYYAGKTITQAIMTFQPIADIYSKEIGYKSSWKSNNRPFILSFQPTVQLDSTTFKFEGNVNYENHQLNFQSTYGPERLRMRGGYSYKWKHEKGSSILSINQIYSQVNESSDYHSVRVKYSYQW